MINIAFTCNIVVYPITFNIKLLVSYDNEVPIQLNDPENNYTIQYNFNTIKRYTINAFISDLNYSNSTTIEILDGKDSFIK